ncbi:putative fatty acyl-CoA reductase CG5065 [Galendromus occidentalis]|uniref:Fatty acyl-CoA reductase n=1 Tax=Galendromus occidentalis TaxID=34638 RepID=A0AAJ7SHP8_9ACAR|nr:putative fatty acyl-CoA reductase CG5065 [Galendromus occidentalis]
MSSSFFLSHVMEQYVGVSEFFAGKTLFVTGCTGFIGKVLLEKILRSCPDVSSIFVLARPKRGKTLEERFAQIFESALFDRVRSESSDLLLKVKFVNGDMLQDRLGVSDEDLQILRKEVDIVVHSAASVRFDAPLRDAVHMNLCGTKKLFDMARTFEKLKVFVHISTCYANCDNDVIEERIYESEHDSEKIMELVEGLDEKSLEKMQEELLAEKPNTYTFTKHLTELMIQKYNETVPFTITIVRPSIVVASMSEPFPGWVDNYNGPSGMVCSTACGLLKSIYSRSEMRTDLIPVNIVAKTVILAAWRAGTTDSKKIGIYNCAIGDRAPSFTWGDFANFQKKLVKEVTFNNAVRYPALTLRSNWTMHKLSMIFQHFLPAFIGDGVLSMIGKKPFLNKAYEQINAMQSALSFFTTHEWTFRTEKLEELSEFLDENDRREFEIDVGSLIWDDFLVDYVRGLRDHVLEEGHKGESTRIRTLYLINQAQNCLLACGALIAIKEIRWLAESLDG